MTSNKIPKRGGEKNNDPHVFEAIILPHRSFLHQVALQLTRNTVEAEDLVQKTLIRAFTHWHTFRNEQCHSSREGTSARAWLKTILRHIFISDLCRQTQKLGRTISLDEFCGRNVCTNGDLPLPSPDTTATPEGILITQAECQAIRRAMHRLPECYGTVLTLIVEEGLPYEEVAVRLNLPLGTVRSRLHRARKHMQRLVSAWQIGTL